MSNSITGTIKVISETIGVSEKFKKREFVVTDNSEPKYPQHISLQFTQDKCMLLNNFDIGDNVTVKYNVRGREWTDNKGELKHFNSLEAWSISDNDSTNDTATKVDHSDLPF